MSSSASIDAQTIVDAIGLGAIYALMAVGIGLVFGVLRLVNFAYGQLIMAGAYTLALTDDVGPAVAGYIVLCFAVVLPSPCPWTGVVFRPLRGASPAVMLVTTFAVAFMLQAVALSSTLRDGRSARSRLLGCPLNQAITVGGVDVHKVTIVAVVRRPRRPGGAGAVADPDDVGLHMRAAAATSRRRGCSACGRTG